MIARKCDRCGDFYEMDSERSVITFSMPGKQDERFDLCPNCTTDFEKWITNKGFVVVVERRN